MAKMIPPVPFESTPSSLERYIFEVFEKKLHDPACEYVVFHSFKISSGVRPLSEIDFIIYHREKGILCIESKAGKISFENRVWKYANGEEIHGGAGPYRQVESAKWALKTEIEKRGLKDITTKCHIGAAVLFPSLSSKDFEGMPEDRVDKMTFGTENNREVTLTKETLENPTHYISKLMDRGCKSLKSHLPLTKNEEELLFSRVFCPVFRLFPSGKEESATLRDRVFLYFSAEQTKILGFIEEQRIAAINGRAGTGKTVVAVEKAEMHARRGEKVLFLCFNRNLRDSLEKRHGNQNIDFMTLDFLGKKIDSNYNRKNRGNLVVRLLQMEEKGESLGYDHVVVDEGQDFVFEKDGTDILSCLQQLTVNDETDNNHSFYVFYDEFQLVQGAKPENLALPPFIKLADCKLTLYRNCRNTPEIAKTTLSPWGMTPRMFEGMADYYGLKKSKPKFVLYPADADLLTVVDRLLQESTYSPHEIVVITCAKVLDAKEQNASNLCQRYDDEAKTYAYNKTDGSRCSCGCYTARTFKGLEAQEVILVDVDAEMFDGSAGIYPRLFYVASSRAKESLKVVVKDGPDFSLRCQQVLSRRHGNDSTYTPPKGNQAKRVLAHELHMEFVKL